MDGDVGITAQVPALLSASNRHPGAVAGALCQVLALPRRVQISSVTISTKRSAAVEVPKPDHFDYGFASIFL
jgi:hypothetical protein